MVSVCWIQNWGARHLLAGAGRPARGQQHPLAGHDVAGMGLPGHLDSPGPDSEVLARVLASTSRLHAGRFEVARTGSGAGLQPC